MEDNKTSKVRQVFQRKSSSRIIDLKGNNRFIEKIVFWYDSVNLSKQKGTTKCTGSLKRKHHTILMPARGKRSKPTETGWVCFIFLTIRDIYPICGGNCVLDFVIVYYRFGWRTKNEGITIVFNPNSIRQIRESIDVRHVINGS